jgi:hypothetical protein
VRSIRIPLVVLISVRRNRDGLTIETALTAAELCTIGLWQRIDGGYRVLDWEAVEFCLDLARQRARKDTQDLAAEHDREALVQMNQPMIITPPCGPCRTYLPALSSSPPDTCRPNAANGPAPSKTASNSNSSQEAVVTAVKGRRHRQRLRPPHQHPSRAGRIARAFRPPLTYAQVNTAGFYHDAGLLATATPPNATTTCT